MTKLQGLALVTGFALTGCQLLGVGRECDSSLTMGITVTVVDSTAGSPISSSEVLVIASDGAYADTATSANSLPSRLFFVVEDRRGTYTVKVLVPGYQPWIKEAVEVTQDDCHVRPVSLTARLQQ